MVQRDEIECRNNKNAADDDDGENKTRKRRTIEIDNTCLSPSLSFILLRPSSINQTRQDKTTQVDIVLARGILSFFSILYNES